MVGLNVHGQKLHGMRSTKWTTFEKVVQYKQLISLQKRDSEVTKYQRDKMRRQEERSLGELRKITKQKQDELRNALLGNQNRMWSTLGEHRKIQLAQGRNQPELVIENLFQMIDLKRKTKDRLAYMKLQLMRKYKNLLLKKGEQDMLLIMQKSGIKTPLERKMQMVCLEKQNAVMRRIAATSVRQTYTHILKILKKDAIYYDSVLDCLEMDSAHQSRMVLSVTEMGQIVTEYLDDINEECKALERNIKLNMRERENSLIGFRSVLENLGKSCKALIRSESDIIVHQSDMDQTQAEKVNALRNEFSKLNDILSEIQGVTFAVTYEQIYPNLNLQLKQRERLEEFASALKLLYNSTRRSSMQLEAILNLVSHTYNEKKIAYLEKKRELLRNIRKNQKRITQIRDKTSKEKDILARLRLGFKHMSQIVQNVRLPDEKDIIKFNQSSDHENLARRFAQKEVPDAVASRDPISLIPTGEDSPELLLIVKEKLAILYAAFKPDGTLTRAAELFFSRATMETCDKVEVEKEIDLLEGLVIEDSRLPSHASVKKDSAQFVADNTVDELALVAAQVAARRKPGAIFRKMIKEEEMRRKSRKGCGIY